MRASVVAETAGVPTVSIVCEGFRRQALATGRGLGLDDLPLAVLRGHVDTQSHDEMIELFREHTIEQIVRGLTEAHDVDDQVSAEPSALEVVASGGIDDIHRLFLDRGWTDGSPFVPPTIARVQALLDGTGHDPFRVIGQARPSGRDITVWSVAVNAVMAGLEQRHLPVVLALAEVLANPQYGVEHSGNTTGADALVVVSGPSIAELGFNSEGGALRDGTHANTAVGRWLRLYLRNVCGFTTAEHDKATFGNSTRVVLAEHEATLASIGWPTLATDLGCHARHRHGRRRPHERRSDRRQRVRQLARRGPAVPRQRTRPRDRLGTHPRVRPRASLVPSAAGDLATAGPAVRTPRMEQGRRAPRPCGSEARAAGVAPGRRSSASGANLTAGRRTLVRSWWRSACCPKVFAESRRPGPPGADRGRPERAPGSPWPATPTAPTPTRTVERRPRTATGRPRRSTVGCRSTSPAGSTAPTSAAEPRPPSSAGSPGCHVPTDHLAARDHWHPRHRASGPGCHALTDHLAARDHWHPRHRASGPGCHALTDDLETRDHWHPDHSAPNSWVPVSAHRRRSAGDRGTQNVRRGPARADVLLDSTPIQRLVTTARAADRCVASCTRRSDA
jgi:hypothetical protein